MDVVKPYHACLSVRTAADETATGASQGLMADLVYDRIAGGECNWRKAVDTAKCAVGSPQWVVIGLSSEAYGFGWCYFDAQGRGFARVVLGGLLAMPIDLPMPETEGCTGSVMGMRAGIVRCTATIEDMIDLLLGDVRNRGLGPVPEGWTLDTDMIVCHPAVIAADCEIHPFPTISCREE